MNNRIVKMEPAYRVEIFIGGLHDDALAICKKFCDKRKECVTITPLSFVYTGGACYGVCIGFINYARFPRKEIEIWNKAVELAEHLKVGLGQGSYTIQDYKNTLFVSTRNEDQ